MFKNKLCKHSKNLTRMTVT